MKKVFAMILVLALSLVLFASCTTTGGSAKGVDLRVATSMGGDDYYRGTFEALFPEWEASSGNTIQNESAYANEEWKLSVLADFEAGNEPDVLFFFNGNDADPLITGGKVVSIDTIRAQYPDYASNIDDGKIVPSPVDGQKYAIPSHGYWEGMFVNKEVLEACGVTMPDENTTWDEFLEICQTIKDAGYIPLSESLAAEPHYLFEFFVMNNGGLANHLALPSEDPAAQAAWVAALADFRDLYAKGFFPEDTNTIGHAEAVEYFCSGQAAFLIDGSWRRGGINTYAADNGVDNTNYTITWVPAKTGNGRVNTDIVAGMSMGWYITTKAWNDDAKREAAISFIQFMTSDASVNRFAEGAAVTALKNGTAPAENATALDLDCIAYMSNYTGSSPAVQDRLSSEAKQVLLVDNMKFVAAGEKTPEKSVEETMAA